MEQFKLRQALRPEDADWTDTALAEAHQSRCIWNQACLASHGGMPDRLGYRNKRPCLWVKYFEKRRKALRELRDLMGAEAYQLGRMPAPVPIWANRRMD